MKTVPSLMAIIIFLAIGGCSERPIEVDGVRVTKQQCRDDLRKLEASIDSVLEIGKVAAREGWQFSKIFDATMFMRHPARLIGPCGHKSRLAFDQFQAAFSSAIPVEIDSDYAALSVDEKERRKVFSTGQLNESRANLDREHQALRERASGGAIGDNSGEVSKSPIVTRSKYDQIRKNMSYSEVRAVIGSDGQVLSSFDTAGYKTVMYSWRNSNGSNMWAIFQNGGISVTGQSYVTGQPDLP